MQCNSVKQPIEIHRAVKEILELMMLRCPGCGATKKYEQMFEHVQSCDKITQAMKTNRIDVLQASGNVNSAANFVAKKSTLSDNIYVIEKDTKVCASFNRKTGAMVKGRLNLLNLRGQPENTLPHNFQLVQVGSQPLVFLVGGGDFAPDPIPASMYMMRQLIWNPADNSSFNLEQKAKMTFPRHGHAVTAFADQYVVVTGSRKDTNTAADKVELYDINKNQWTKLANMRYGRHYHSSCEFNSEYVFVFCGIQNQNKKYFNYIERLNVKASLNNFNVAWEVINCTDPAKTKAVSIPPRQGNGACQQDDNTIVILGGFGGKFFSDCWDFNPNQNTLKPSPVQLGRECFPFAVPTVSDVNDGEVYTVDWKTMQMLRLKNRTWTNVKNIKE